MGKVINWSKSSNVIETILSYKKEREALWLIGMSSASGSEGPNFKPYGKYISRYAYIFILFKINM